MQIGCDSQYRPDEPTLDVVALVRSFKDSRRAQVAVRKLLISRRLYIPQNQPLRTLVESIRAGLPLTAEGLPGCGKTDCAESLAHAANIPLFKIACRPGIQQDALLYSWNDDARRVFIENFVRQGGAPEIALQRSYTKEFLNPGLVLKAFSAMAVHRLVMMLFDEIDKIEGQQVDTLLEALSSFKANVDRLTPQSTISIPNPDQRPLVFATSNDMYGGVSSAMKQRGLFVYFNQPDRQERARILAIKSKDASPSLLTDAFCVLEHIQTECRNLSEKPGLRNGIWFLNSLVEEGVEYITPDVFLSKLGYLAFTREDQFVLEKKAYSIFNEIKIQREKVQPVIAEALQFRDDILGFAETAKDEVDGMFLSFGYMPQSPPPDQPTSTSSYGFDEALPELTDLSSSFPLPSNRPPFEPLSFLEKDVDDLFERYPNP